MKPYTSLLIPKTFAILILLALSLNSLASECVILLHGLARSKSSMETIETKLEKEGYRAVNLGYPSTQKTVEELSVPAIDSAIKACGQRAKIHFVTHSMGGILVRHYLTQKPIRNLGRVVMLGPPNKGSQVVDNLSSVPGFKLINGPAGLQLGTGSNSVPNTLGPVTYEVGIIAGTKSMNLILSNYLPNPDDGKVSVENTKLEGMKDHIRVPTTHTFMMQNEKVIAQILYFLKRGSFNKQPNNQVPK